MVGCVGIHVGRQTSNQRDRDKQAGERTSIPALIYDELADNVPHNSEHGEGRTAASEQAQAPRRWRWRRPPSYPAEGPVPKINEREECVQDLGVSRLVYAYRPFK